MMFGLAAVPLVAITGAAVDYSRVAQAHTKAQLLVDSAAIAAARYGGGQQSEMSRIVGDILTAGSQGDPDGPLTMTNVTYSSSDDSVTVAADGSVPSAFMKIVGISQMPYAVSAVAKRDTQGTIEVAMVLDNTWSMSEADASGVTKITALKTAAENLTTKLKASGKDAVKIGLVPYGENVNVGTGNRYQSWMSVPADTSTTSQQTCTTNTTQQQCTRGTPQTCTRYQDGVPSSYDCTPSTCTTVTVAPYQSCSGGGTTNKTWYGCTGSRTTGNLRLTDDQPQVPYPGFLATSQQCLNPIVPLTVDQTTVVNAIHGMVVNIGGYKPETYIPAGLIWGVNILSPGAPFTEGAAYDPNNVLPRKVLILMTDGANTRQFNPSDPWGGTTGATTSTVPDQDSLSVCTYAKSKNIEVFTVAFMVAPGAPKTLLQTCATDSAHYFDASDSTALLASFSKIADSLSGIRISQ